MLWGCSRDSIVAFFWRDRREHGAGSTVPFDIYGSVSFDGGATFLPNFEVSTQSSQFDSILLKGNDFLDCDIGSGIIYVVWGDLRDTSSHLDVYMAGLPIEELGRREELKRPSMDSKIPFSPSGRKSAQGRILLYPDGRKVIRLR